MRVTAGLIFVFLVGCVEIAPPAPRPEPVASRSSGVVTSQTLERVANRIIPIAERECVRRSRTRNCQFAVGLDANPSAPPNAFQTEGDNGQPLLIFTAALLRDLRNVDELAFILSHEAAHHIESHLAETNKNANTGALLGGALAAILGADTSLVDTAVRAGAVVGSRAYSKEYELEADSTGARIAQSAGYDPVRGAAYFARIPDPGNRFLGSHPPNADRVNTVRRAVGAI